MTDTEFSRGDVLLKGALAAGTIVGLGAVSPLVRSALAADEHDDVEVLNFLLPFEYMLASLYNRGLSEVNDHDEKMPLKDDQRELLETLLGEEGEHVAAIRETIEEMGGKPIAKGGFAFAFREYDTLLELGVRIESIAIGAYNGAIPTLKSRDARTLTSSIVQVEGRHVAKLSILREEQPAPVAFDLGETEETAAVGLLPFIGTAAMEKEFPTVFPGK
jgi:rubrerythrin